MENFKSTLFTLFLLVVMGAVGYWAFSTIEPGNVHVNNQKQKELEIKNEELEKEIIILKSKVSLLESTSEVASVVIPTSDIKPVDPVTPIKTVTPAPIVSKYQTQINELQKLINDNIYMKKGSKGERVGTVQRFINIYNNTTSRVDNDYGPGLITAVTKFQKDQKITADGETGPNTYRKMIEWLNTR